MYKKIILATDGSKLADKAVESGLMLAKALGAQPIVVTVTEQWPLVEIAAQAEMGVKDPVGLYEAQAEKRADGILAAAAELARSHGLSCEQVHVKDRHPAEGIIETALAKPADLIVIASHGRRGVSKLLLGSVAQEVLARSSVPVLVVR